MREMRDPGRFRVPGIAGLVPVERKARRGRDPLTGEPMVIPARMVLQARISRQVRDAAELPL